jgi:spore coat polysaccharide biosynthesis protein SpsF (cytidylyltransferase family)
MIIAFIPCRLKSNRLPNKGLLEINGVPSIKRTINNALHIKGVDKVILATSTDIEDDPLEIFASNSVEVVRGSADDVLARFIPSILKYKPEHILRITGDCPVVSYEMSSELIESHTVSGADITYPSDGIAIGLGCEVYKSEAILKLLTYFESTMYSEYLIYYFTNNPDFFSINKIEVQSKYSKDWRLTLDEFNDLELLNDIFKYHSIYDFPISFAQIESYFETFPEKVSINKNNFVKYKQDHHLIKVLKENTTIKHTN